MAWKLKNNLLYEEDICKKGNLELFVTTKPFGNMRDTAQRNGLSKTLDIDFSNLVYGQQVHGNDILVVNDSIDKNCIENIDGIVANRSFVPLAVFTADCVPVFIVDVPNRAVGLLHGGWKGLYSKIIDKGFSIMNKFYNTKPADCLIAIGPHIQACCYVVGRDVRDKFNDAECEKLSSDLWRLDLEKVIRRQLKELGIKSKNISACNMCTFHETGLFFSYRREKENNRMMSLVMLK